MGIERGPTLGAAPRLNTGLWSRGISESIAAEVEAMSHRILLWAVVGFLVAAGWAIYAFPMMTSSDPLMPLVVLTCPIALLRSHPVSLALVLLANSATYAFVGLAVETVRRQLTPAR